MPLMAKTSKGRMICLSLLVLLIAAVVWKAAVELANRPSPASLSRLLVLDDLDDDFRKPPFEDSVYSFAGRQAVPKVADLNICQTVGGTRMLSIAENGQCFVVCENVGNHLIAYQPQTGQRLWRLDGNFQAATVARNGSIYALTSSGTIYGDEVVLINPRGELEKKAKVGGFDLVVDEERRVFWTVGSNIKKCDLDLNLLWETNLIGWCAVSVDLNADGSVWVAEREHPNVSGSQDRLLKISPTGEVLKSLSLSFSPMCLRINRTAGSVWVTGAKGRESKTVQALNWIEKRTGRWPLWRGARDFLMRGQYTSHTEKRDANGTLLKQINQGGHTLAIDPSDGSVWVAGRTKLFHYSNEGTKRGRKGGFSDSQIYVIALPEAAQVHLQSGLPQNP